MNNLTGRHQTAVSTFPVMLVDITGSMTSTGIDAVGMLIEVAQAALLTALDLPVDDTGVHHVGHCRVVTVQHVDCGLTW